MCLLLASPVEYEAVPLINLTSFKVRWEEVDWQRREGESGLPVPAAALDITSSPQGVRALERVDGRGREFVLHGKAIKISAFSICRHLGNFLVEKFFIQIEMN